MGNPLVRFCAGAGEQPKVWLRYCGTAGKTRRQTEKTKRQPVAMRGPGLLDLFIDLDGLKYFKNTKGERN